jgi:hypothetical protein
MGYQVVTGQDDDEWDSGSWQLIPTLVHSSINMSISDTPTS